MLCLLQTHTRKRETELGCHSITMELPAPPRQSLDFQYLSFTALSPVVHWTPSSGHPGYPEVSWVADVTLDTTQTYTTSSHTHTRLIVSQPSSGKEVLLLLSNKWDELYKKRNSLSSKAWTGRVSLKSTKLMTSSRIKIWMQLGQYQLSEYAFLLATLLLRSRPGSRCQEVSWWSPI